MKSFLFLLFFAGLALASDPEDFFKKVDEKISKKISKFYIDSADPEGTLMLTRTESYKDGVLVSITVEGPSNSVNYYEHDYDDKGHPKERRQLDADRKLYGKFSYTYVEDGSYKVRVYRCDADGKEVSGTVVDYAYDIGGRWLSAENVHVSGLVRRRENEYDVAGKLTKSTLSSTMNGTKEVDEIVTYSYYANGHLKEAKTNSGDGDPVDKAVFNTRGDMISFAQYDGLGNVAQRVEITPGYKAGDKRISEIWKVFVGDEKIPRASGRSTFEYEYAK
ncbi:MAG: hypothetical protein Q7S83_02085 [bacterium]|nr:hypothetical protein [bacterium]